MMDRVCICLRFYDDQLINRLSERGGYIGGCDMVGGTIGILLSGRLYTCYAVDWCVIGCDFILSFDTATHVVVDDSNISVGMKNTVDGYMKRSAGSVFSNALIV